MKSSVNINLDSLIVITDIFFPDGEFLSMLKVAEVFLVYQKKDNLDKESYMPVSALFTMSKIPDRLMYKQTEEFTKNSGE